MMGVTGGVVVEERLSVRKFGITNWLQRLAVQYIVSSAPVLDGFKSWEYRKVRDLGGRHLGLSTTGDCILGTLERAPVRRQIPNYRLLWIVSRRSRSAAPFPGKNR
jgi:hypothetical protein